MKRPHSKGIPLKKHYGQYFLRDISIVHDMLSAVSIKDGNTNTIAYEYDEFDRVKKMIYPDLAEENYTYDASSNLKTKTNAKSQVITYTYDELNRLTYKAYTGCAESVCGGDVDYVYDEGSRMTYASNARAINDYVYDALNRVKTSTRIFRFTAIRTILIKIRIRIGL